MFLSLFCRTARPAVRLSLSYPSTHPPTLHSLSESRWFQAWRPDRGLEPFRLPPSTHAAITARHPGSPPTVPFGHALIRCADGPAIAHECCEELFTPLPPHALAALAGADVFGNGSGSHHQLRKLHTRLAVLTSATAACGGAYLYANQRGCDGGRLYFDGCAAVAVNGAMVALGAQFGLAEVEVVTAAVDLGAVAAYRGARASFQAQAAGGVGAPGALAVAAWTMPEVEAPGFALCSPTPVTPTPPLPTPVRSHSPSEEIALGPACWLWDYLRRSGASGFVLPLSGGADSGAVAAIVGAMAGLVVRAAAAGDPGVAADARRVGGYGPGEPLGGPASFTSRILLTAYLASATASTEASRSRAAAVAADVGSTHVECAIDGLVGAALGALSGGVGGLLASTSPSPSQMPQPRCRAAGGSPTEAVALQNLQARSRMVLTFLLAQLGPWVLGEAAKVSTSGATPPSPLPGAALNPAGFRLVLSASNVDEALWGYLTKYDCSAGDLNPIGGVSKTDLKAFLEWAAQPAPDGLGFPSLAAVAAAPPSAELEPAGAGPDGGSAGNGPRPREQTDEDDMGVTYADLATLGAARTLARCGPASMFAALAAGPWSGRPPAAVAATVKRFWTAHGANRHKATTLTPAYHAEAYSPDDNRFDQRPFLYNRGWGAQFRAIDAGVREREEEGGGEGGAGRR